MGNWHGLMAAGGACTACGVFAWGAVAPSSQMLGPTIRETGDTSTIALTFDDGPNPAVTPSLLDLLDRHGAKATFFVIGERVRLFPSLTKEIAVRGHAIGNHTENHRALTFLTPRLIEEQLAQCDEAIESATGGRAHVMRPPWGFRGPQLQRVMEARNAASGGGGSVVMWSAAARDWNVQPADRVIRRLRGVKGGDIVLLHDGDHRVPEGDRRHTVAALEYWLPRWKDSGLRFVALDESREKKAQAGKSDDGRETVLRREGRDKTDSARVPALPARE